jgi:CDP-glucose 4,6-dehydratase
VVAEREGALEGVGMKRDFWKKRKVLLTGHTGFKGSWLTLWLQDLGAEVTGYALPPPTEPSLFGVARVAERMESIVGDVRDLESLERALSDRRPEIVIHMAAQALVRYSYDHPVETFDTNIMGTVNVLEAVRRCGHVRVLVNITSDKCYENQEWVWGYRENERMGGHDPYSSSKGCAELVTEAYRRSYFSSTGNERVAVATARAGNVIGGGDWAMDRLVPDIMKALMENKAPIIRFPHAIRPWQHVLEPLCGYLTLAEKLWEEPQRHCGAWNFGPSDDEARPVSWLAESLTQRWGDGATWKDDQKENPHEANYLKLDSSKARMLLRWKPRLDLSESLAWVVAWYRAYLGGEDMRRVSQLQIADYEELCGGLRA